MKRVFLNSSFPRKRESLCYTLTRSISLIALILSITISTRAFADDERASQPPPYLKSAWKAINSGDTKKGLSILKIASKCWQRYGKQCGFSRADFQELLGITYLHQNKLKDAIKVFKIAIKDQPDRAESHFYLGQSYYRLGRYHEAIASLKKASKLGESLPAYYLILSRAQEKAKLPEDARKTLAKGISRLKEESSLLRELSLLFLRRGFYQGALIYARFSQYSKTQHNNSSFPQKRESLQQNAAFDPLLHLMIADSLRRSGHLKDAIIVLEEALLLSPDSTKIKERLALYYAAAHYPTASLSLLLSLPIEDQERLAYLIAEEYRLAKRYRDALRYNSFVQKPKKRRLQRAAIFIDSGSFDQAYYQLQPLWKSQQLKPAESYRFAYVAMKTMRFDLTKKVATTLKNTAFASSAERLENALKQCKDQPWACVE